jgi:hypothetical protein
MTITALFPFLNGALNLCAGVVYCFKGGWRMVIFYVALAVANFALAGVR